VVKRLNSAELYLVDVAPAKEVIPNLKVAILKNYVSTFDYTNAQSIIGQDRVDSWSCYSLQVSHW